jgi:hypothetical protein
MLTSHGYFNRFLQLKFKNYLRSQRIHGTIQKKKRKQNVYIKSE